MITGSEKLSTRPGQVAAKVIDGEAILINLTTGMYYSMQNVAGRIWSLIEQGLGTAEIVAAITAEFEVAEETARSDVHALIEQLIVEELIEVLPASHASKDSPAVELTTAGGPYATPELRKFSDMAEMFALDPPLPGLADTNDG